MAEIFICISFKYSFDILITRVLFWGSNWQYVSIGSGTNPVKWKDIKWTNAD